MHVIGYLVNTSDIGITYGGPLVISLLVWRASRLGFTHLTGMVSMHTLTVQLMEQTPVAPRRSCDQLELSSGAVRN